MPEHRRSFVNVDGVIRAGLADTGVVAPGLIPEEENGQVTGENGPIVDLIGDRAWLATAGLAKTTRGA